MAVVLNWNGEEISEDLRGRMPKELRELPQGRYVLESVDDAPKLTVEDEDAIQAAIESVRAGRGLRFEKFQERIGRAVRK